MKTPLFFADFLQCISPFNLGIILDKKGKNEYNFNVRLFCEEKACQVLLRYLFQKEKAVKYNRNVYQSLMMITQFGINMLVPIFLCTFMGIEIDRYFETEVWAVILFFVGALAGFTNVFRFAKKIYEKPAVTRRRSTKKTEQSEETE